MSDIYRPIESEDKEFHLSPVTWGTYERLKVAQLQCSAIDNQTKFSIAAEFNLNVKELEEIQKTKIGTKELYKIYADNIFIETPEKFEFDDMNIQEINRAAKDFFLKAAGL
uniref:Uncharacterized protein n=1 Tax=viral metagenome TaxID=1070528 RepID=A0A6M3XPK7_9ZZZZ